MLLQVSEDVNGSVLRIHVCREDVALVFGLELLGAIVMCFSIV